MAKLLYIESSPRKTRSHSIAVARSFLDAYREAHPGDQVETWDLWAMQLPEETGPLPEIDGELLTARYLQGSGQQLTPEQQAAWERVQKLGDRFKSADKYLFSLPMWNFNIPYKLKHFIDVITHPGITFSYNPETGYQGLVTGKPVMLVLARGGAYPKEFEAMDFQRRYMESWLRFIGFTDIREIIDEGTLNPATVAEADQKARETAVREAKNF